MFLHNPIGHHRIAVSYSPVMPQSLMLPILHTDEGTVKGDLKKMNDKPGNLDGRYAHEWIAEAYMRRLKAYEDATSIMKNRYVYAVIQKSREEEISHLEDEFRIMEKRTNAIRQDLFRTMAKMHRKRDRKVLWLRYIEMKSYDEIAGELYIAKFEAYKKIIDGLRMLEVPQAFSEDILKRNS